MKAIRSMVVALVVLFPEAVIEANEENKAMPKERIEEFQSLQFGMFICWSLSSFSGYEWTPGVEDIDFFHPTGCDPDQWCRVAKEAGMNYILFLTKHHDGFCLWDTGTTDRKVSKTKALAGRDVLAEVRQACQRHGLKLALYFSEGDWSWTDRKDIHQSAARPDIKKAQLKELLSTYGPIEFIWFDRAIGDGGLSHGGTAALVKELQPRIQFRGSRRQRRCVHRAGHELSHVGRRQQRRGGFRDRDRLERRLHFLRVQPGGDLPGPGGQFHHRQRCDGAGLREAEGERRRESRLCRVGGTSKRPHLAFPQP
jgi:hypothetical protein